ncbi:MAG: macro domain-containing protein [Chloroflexota bacterium]
MLNFPTKQHWRSKSKPEYVEAGLQAFVATYADAGITSAAFPMLGCGAGGLNWLTQVKPLMERYLSPLPMDISIYLYNGLTASAS